MKDFFSNYKKPVIISSILTVLQFFSYFGNYSNNHSIAETIGIDRVSSLYGLFYFMGLNIFIITAIIIMIVAIILSIKKDSKHKFKFKDTFLFKNLFPLLLLLYLTYSSIFAVILNEIGINVKNFNVTEKTITFILFELIFLLFLCFIYKDDLKEEFIIYKNNFKNIITFSLKYWCIGLLLMGLSNIILHFVLHSSPNNEDNVQKLLSEMPVYVAIISCFFAPIIEELIFRKSLSKCFSNTLLFIICSGLIFGLLHVITSKNMIDFLYIIPYGVFGSIFAYIYYKTKTIFSTITIHMIHNTILIIISLCSLGVM